MKTAPRFSKLRPIPAGILTSFGTAAAFLIPDLALANPSGGTVVGGQATITTPSANGMVINQTSASTIINWNQFNIGSGQYVQFVQPSSSSVALNRVIGGSPTSIFGSLEANGRVFLVNPEGVLFAPGSTVDVGGLMATTMDIKDSDFMSGNYVFSGTGAPGASVVNAGTITTTAGGFAVLAGDSVSNSGIIQAQLGQIVLASGSATTLNLDGSGLINYSIDQAALSAHAGVTNTGQLIADGGRVVMAASTARALIGTVVNNSGIIRADGISNHDGQIELTASGGDIVDTGTLDVSNAAGEGGAIAITGDRDVTLGKGASVLANGSSGGAVNVIADDTLDLAEGSLIQAVGSSGPGGFAEVSGHGLLDIRGAIALGRGGSLLIDPTNLVIGNESSTSSGYASSTNQTITQTFLQNQLQGGTEVELIATNSITFDALTGGKLVGTNGGEGGSLLIGIGTVTNAPDPGQVLETGTFTQGTGGGSITALNTTDTIAVDGNLTVESGSGTGTISLGGLSGFSVLMNAGGAISVGNTINATDQVIIRSYNGTITTHDVAVTNSDMTYPQEQSGISIVTGNTSVDTGLTSGGAAIVTGNLTVTNTSPVGYADATILVNSSGSSVQTASLQASSANEKGAVTVMADGNLHVAGSLSASGVGFFDTDGAAVTLTSTQSITVDDSTLLSASAGTETESSDLGRTTVTRGNAELLVTSTGGDITMGSVSVRGVGDSTFNASAADSIAINGTINVTATLASFVGPITDTAYTATEEDGGAAVSLEASSGSFGATSTLIPLEGPNNTTSVTTHGISVSGPSAELVVAGGTLDLKASDGGDAVNVVANTGTTGRTENTFTEEDSSLVSNAAPAIVQLIGLGGSSSTPSIASGSINVAGPSATLNLVADGNITINGGLTVQGLGSTVTGDMTLEPELLPASVNGNNNITLYGYLGALNQPVLQSGTETVGQGLLTISGDLYNSNDTAPPRFALTVGAVDVTGPIAISGVGSANLNVQAASFTAGAVTVSATAGSLQGTAVSSIYTSGSADSSSYAGYTISRTIGPTSPASFGLASAQITTTGDISVSSVGLTGLSGQLNFSAANVTAPGGISVTNTQGTPSYIETDSLSTFSYGGAAAPTVPATAGTTWTGDINQLVITATGALSTGDITLSGAGLTDLHLSGGTVNVGNVTLTQTAGLFVSNDPSRVSGSYSYANAGSQLYLEATGGTLPSALSINATSSNSLAVTMDATVTGALQITTPDFLTTLPGVEGLTNPVFQPLPTAPGPAAPTDTVFFGDLRASADSATLTLGPSATLDQISLTTTHALLIQTETTGTLTLNSDTTLTGGSIEFEGLDLVAHNLTLVSTSGPISGNDVTATSLTVSSAGDVNFGNITTSATGGITPGGDEGGPANAAINITAAGSIDLNNVSASANAFAATATVTLQAGTSVQVGTVTTTATGNSTDANNSSGLNDADAEISITAGNGALALSGPVSSNITTNADSLVQGDIALTATGGEITGTKVTSSDGGIAITNNTGDVTLTDLSSTLGFGPVTVDAPNGFVSVGTISATGGGVSLTAGAVNPATGDGLETGPITTFGNTNAGAYAGSVTLVANAGDLVVNGAISTTDASTGGVNASVSVQDSAGNISLGTVTTNASDAGENAQGQVQIADSTGTVTVGDISTAAYGGTANATVTVAAGTGLTMGTITTSALGSSTTAAAFGGVMLTATSGNLSAGLISATATGGTDPTTGGGSANAAVDVTAAGPLALDGITTTVNAASAIGDVSLTGGSVQVGAVTTNATGNSTDTTDASNANTVSGTIGVTSTDGALTLTGPLSSNLTIGSVTDANANIALTATGGDITGGDLTSSFAGITVSNTTGNVTLGNLMSSGGFSTITVNAPSGFVSLGTINVTQGGVSLTAGGINPANGDGLLTGPISTNSSADTTTTGSSVMLVASAGNLDVNGEISADDQSTAATGANASLTVLATAGNITLGQVDTNAVDLGQDATATIQIASKTGSVSTGDLQANAAGATATGTIALGAGTSVSAGTLETIARTGSAEGAAYGGVVLAADDGSMVIGDIGTDPSGISGAYLDGSAKLSDTGGNIQFGTIQTVAGAINLTDTTGNIIGGGSLSTDLATGQAGAGNISATADAGSIDVGAVTAYGGSIVLSAGTGLQAAGITSTALAPAAGQTGEDDASVMLSTTGGTLAVGSILTSALVASSPSANASVTISDGTGPIDLVGISTSASASPTGGAANASIDITATKGAVTFGSAGTITTAATGATANASVALAAGTSLTEPAAITTSATENSTDTTNSGGLNAADADVAITAGDGALTLDTVTTNVSFANPSTVDGAVVLAASGGDVSTGALSTTYGGVVINNSTGNITTGNLTTAGAFGSIDIDATAGWVVVPTLTAVGGVTIASGGTNPTTGDGLMTGAISTVSDPSQQQSTAAVSLTAASGNLVVSGPIQTKAASTNTLTDADGSVTVLANAGNVSLGTVTASASEGGGTGELADANVSITSDAGSVTVTDVSATAQGNQVTATEQLAAGTTLSANALSTAVSASGTDGQASGSISLAANNGNLNVATIATTIAAMAGSSEDGSVGVSDSGGNLAVGTITTGAGGIAVSATTGNVTTGNLTTGGPSVVELGFIEVSSTAGTLTLGNLSATGGNVQLNAATGLSVGSITTAASSLETGSINDSITIIQQSGNLSLSNPITASAISSVGTPGSASITITDTAGTVTLGDVSATATSSGSTTALVTVTGGAGVAVNSVTTTDGISLQSASGNVAVTDTLTAGTNLTIDAAGSVTVGGASQLGSAGDGALMVSAGTGVTMGFIANDSAATAVGLANDMSIASSSGNIVLGDIGVPATGTSSLSVTATDGSITTGDVTVERINFSAMATGADITTGNLSLFSLTPALAEDSKLDAGGKLLVGTVSTDGGLTAAAGGASLQIGNASANGDITLTATSGTLTAGTIVAGGTLTATAGGASLQLGNASASGDIALTATSGTLTTGTLTGGGALTATAGGASLQLGDTTVTGAVDLTASSGNLDLADLSGGTVALNTGNDFTYGHTLQSTGSVAITGGGAISFNEATVEGDQVTVTATKGITLSSSTVGIVTADGLTTVKGALPLSDTVTLTSSTGDVDLSDSTITSGLVTLTGDNLHLSNASTINGTEVVLTGTGLVDAGTVVAGASDGSTITAGALSVKGNQIDFSNAVLNVGSGLANFGTDSALISGIRGADPALVPASSGPNAAFSAPAGITLGTISVAGGYLYLQSNTLVLPSPTGSGTVFINYVPTDPASALTLTGVTPPAGAMTIALGGSSQTGNITFGDGTEHFNIAPLGTNFVLETAGTIFYPDAIVTSGRVITLGKTVFEVNPTPPLVIALVPEDAPLTDEEYRTEYVTPTIELLPDLGSLIDIVTSTGATACGVGGGI